MYNELRSYCPQPRIHPPISSKSFSCLSACFKYTHASRTHSHSSCVSIPYLNFHTASTSWPSRRMFNHKSIAAVAPFLHSPRAAFGSPRALAAPAACARAPPLQTSRPFRRAHAWPPQPLQPLPRSRPRWGRQRRQGSPPVVTLVPPPVPPPLPLSPRHCPTAPP